MTLRSYLLGMKLATAFSFLAWTLVLFYVDPDKNGLIGQFFFFFSLFLFLSGFFIIFLVWLNRKFERNGEVSQIYFLSASFRQGILLSLLFVSLMIFQENKILTWWDGSLVVAGFLLVELYFLTKTKS